LQNIKYFLQFCEQHTAYFHPNTAMNSMWLTAHEFELQDCTRDD